MFAIHKPQKLSSLCVSVQLESWLQPQHLCCSEWAQELAKRSWEAGKCYQRAEDSQNTVCFFDTNSLSPAGHQYQQPSSREEIGIKKVVVSARIYASPFFFFFFGVIRRNRESTPIWYSPFWCAVLWSRTCNRPAGNNMLIHFLHLCKVTWTQTYNPYELSAQQQWELCHTLYCHTESRPLCFIFQSAQKLW